ncbi:hypothetical protein [Isobaculum melis]|uniref:Uncharacterized protein n=1 Tax=Isobaculum melis TaxID=142588 RepID=A0A1H9UDA9_9LACT|nr:hypothetical protein [Isobaculum melis]SES07426.1 hypothetical protein SAMN04488559_12726 [Isobaculum melis]
MEDKIEKALENMTPQMSYIGIGLGIIAIIIGIIFLFTSKRPGAKKNRTTIGLILIGAGAIATCNSLFQIL